MASVSELMARIDLLKKELDALRPLDRELEDRVLQKFRLWWTYHSNAIEGNKLTQGETEMFLMEGLTAKGKPLKDHLDLQGHSNAINYLLAFVRENEVLTEVSIRKLHEILLVEAYRVPAITADGHETTKNVVLGEYKSQPNHVRTPTGEIHYYASPVDTPIKMRELVDWQRAQSGQLHPVEIAARFHHMFTEIHPFDDGNGRMARLLMNLFLMQAGYPPVVIRIGDRDEYLSALRQADRNDHEPFASFIAERVIGSLELYLLGAQGEDIHEPTDLEKEIALLKLELQHVEEPLPLTAEVQKKIFVESVIPLVEEIRTLSNPFCELFSESSITFSGEYGSIRDQRSIRRKFDFPNPGLTLWGDEWWRGDRVVKILNIRFEFKGFKKAYFDNFDLSCVLRLSFEQFKYIITVHAVDPSISIQHLYQDQFGQDEIKAIAQKVARIFLDIIKNKTSSKV